VDFHDAAAHHLFNAKGVAVPRHLLSFSQQPAGLAEKEACQRDVLIRFGDFQRQPFIQFTDGNACIDQAAAVRA
jgi:hypothetical protein